MRSKEQFENERYFGLQKFDTAEEAFSVMEGIWGEANAEDSKELHILTDETFKKAIVSRAITIYLDYKEGEKTEEALNRAFGLGEDIDDTLLDFDFFLYSQKSNCYFTCRMSMKDDAVYMWNDRQWGYFKDLWEAYSLKEVIKKAITLVDEAEEKIGEFDRPGICDIVYNEQGLFF